MGLRHDSEVADSITRGDLTVHCFKQNVTNGVAVQNAVSQGASPVQRVEDAAGQHGGIGWNWGKPLSRDIDLGVGARNILFRMSSPRAGLSGILCVRP